jgi:hypothetical protein
MVWLCEFSVSFVSSVVSSLFFLTTEITETTKDTQSREKD